MSFCKYACKQFLGTLCKKLVHLKGQMTDDNQERFKLGIYASRSFFPFLLLTEAFPHVLSFQYMCVGVCVCKNRMWFYLKCIKNCAQLRVGALLVCLAETQPWKFQVFEIKLLKGKDCSFSCFNSFLFISCSLKSRPFEKTNAQMTTWKVEWFNSTFVLGSMNQD